MTGVARPFGAKPRALASAALARATALRVSPVFALYLVVLAAFALRAAWLTQPSGALIFDEAYYVNAARVILGWDVSAAAHYRDAPAGLDPNVEHPPLGKLVIAGAMVVLGDNAVGARLPSLVASLATIVLLYLVARALGGSAWLAVGAAAVLAADNLALVHGRIATLDAMLGAFLLLGAWCWLRGWPIAAGCSFAAATLVKLAGAYGLAAVTLFELTRLLRSRADRSLIRRRTRDLALCAVAFLAVGGGGLFALDRAVTRFATPWDHLAHMASYGLGLSRERGPANSESHPWQWLVNEVQITYLRVDETVSAGQEVRERRALIHFRGALNPALGGVAIVALGYAAWRALRERDEIALWSATWFAAMWLPYAALDLLAHRIAYLFYVLPGVPAIALAATSLFLDRRLPRAAWWAFCAAIALALLAYYPIRRLP